MLTKKGPFAILLAAALLLGGCNGTNMATFDDVPDTIQGEEATGAPMDTTDAPSGEPELQVLLDWFNCDGKNTRGFYGVDIPQSDMYQNLMFYDYEKCEQCYLCDAPGCAHNAPGCTSYLDTYGGVYTFTIGEYLFVNYALYDDGTPDRNDWPSALEKRNLDGTGAELMLTYPSCDLQLMQAFGTEEYLFFEAPDGFVKVNIETNEKTVVMQVGEAYTDAATGQSFDDTEYMWYLTKYQNRILCLREEQDLTRTLVLLNPHTGEQSWVRTFQEDDTWGYNFDEEGKNYYVDRKTGVVHLYDLATDTDVVITDMFAELNEPEMRDYGESEEIYYPAEAWDVTNVGDWVIVHLWELDDAGNPVTGSIAYHMTTGETKEITLGDFFNGYVHRLHVYSETPYGLLVREESRARMIHTTGTGGEPYSFESSFDVYALLDPEDYINSQPNFRTIVPVEYSGT